MADKEEWELLIESADHESGVITAVPYFPAAEGIKLPADGGIAALLAAPPRRFEEIYVEILPPREWDLRKLEEKAPFGQDPHSAT